jgi:hypothetical protein
VLDAQLAYEASSELGLLRFVHPRAVAAATGCGFGFLLISLLASACFNQLETLYRLVPN